MGKKIRVRSKRLSQLDESKLALAVWLLAKDMVEDKTVTSPENGEPDNDDWHAQEGV